MEDGKISVFDIVLLVVGISVVFLGFQLINKAYKAEQSQFGWLMIIAIFSWLTLMILFILLSVMVDVSKKELREIRALIYMLSEKQDMINSKKKK